jgi:hypothetical protein
MDKPITIHIEITLTVTPLLEKLISEVAQAIARREQAQRRRAAEDEMARIVGATESRGKE